MPSLRDVLPESGLTPYELPVQPGASTGNVTRAYVVDEVVNAFNRTAFARSERVPLSMTLEVDGPEAIAAGSSNTVGLVLSPTFSDDFTGITGTDAGLLLGLNVFAQGAADLDGATTLQAAIIEMAVLQETGTIAVVRGLEVDCSLFGAGAGATITQAESLRVASPKKKEGATGGEIVNAYGLVVEEVDEGTATNFSVLVQGGTSRFGGPVQVDQHVYGTSGDLTLHGSEEGVGAQVLIGDGSGAGHHHVIARTGASTYSDRFIVQDADGDEAAFITSTGTIGLPLATTSASASAGGGSALPALPVSYFAMEINNVTRYIPYYAAP